MTNVEKDEHGIEDEGEDRTFSVNRIVMENIDCAVTKEDIIQETEMNHALFQLVDDINKGRISDKLMTKPYGKVF